MCIDGPRGTKTPCEQAQKSDTDFSDTDFSAAVNHGAVDHVNSDRDKAILAVVDIGHIWE